ncbi:NAD(P)H-dependent oxidoreductase [Gordonia araii]|nr:NAD(P)H-dependent oxidoreductase [Gordonia araii]NNG96294.1 NAD(P)H-dependent oxidoreductase [Gordonia araii NBRC 100433]
MSRKPVIAVLVGSLRTRSINRQLARIAVDNAPEGVVVKIVDGLGELPFYNADADPSTSDGVGARLDGRVAALRAEVEAADGVLLVTPEYNGSLPAALKNALDWLSRPYGAGALIGKPVGIIGASLARGAGERMRTDAVKVVGVAGGHIVEDVRVALRTSELGERGVADEEIVSQVTEAVEVLADAIEARAAV